MFFKTEKDVSNYSHARVTSSKEKRDLRLEITRQFPEINPKLLDSLIGPNSGGAQLHVSKMSLEVLLYIRNGLPLLFERIKSRTLFPTLFTLWKYPSMLPAIIVHEEMSEYCLKGADVLMGGVVSLGEVSDVRKGDPVCMRIEGNPLPFAVGSAIATGADMIKAYKKNRSLKILLTLHYHGDALCERPELEFLPVPRGFEPHKINAIQNTNNIVGSNGTSTDDAWSPGKGDNEAYSHDNKSSMSRPPPPPGPPGAPPPPPPPSSTAPPPPPMRSTNGSSVNSVPAEAVILRADLLESRFEDLKDEVEQHKVRYEEALDKIIDQQVDLLRHADDKSSRLGKLCADALSSASGSRERVAELSDEMSNQTKKLSELGQHRQLLELDLRDTDRGLKETRTHINNLIEDVASLKLDQQHIEKETTDILSHLLEQHKAKEDEAREMKMEIKELRKQNALLTELVESRPTTEELLAAINMCKAEARDEAKRVLVDEMIDNRGSSNSRSSSPAPTSTSRSPTSFGFGFGKGSTTSTATSKTTTSRATTSGFAKIISRPTFVVKAEDLDHLEFSNIKAHSLDDGTFAGWVYHKDDSTNGEYKRRYMLLRKDKLSIVKQEEDAYRMGKEIVKIQLEAGSFCQASAISSRISSVLLYNTENKLQLTVVPDYPIQSEIVAWVDAIERSVDDINLVKNPGVNNIFDKKILQERRDSIALDNAEVVYGTYIMKQALDTKKKRILNPWQKRYLTLKSNGGLVYANNEKNIYIPAKVKGRILLESFMDIVSIDKDIFEIAVRGQALFRARCTSPTNRDEWVRRLQQAVAYLQTDIHKRSTLRNMDKLLLNDQHDDDDDDSSSLNESLGGAGSESSNTDLNIRDSTVELALEQYKKQSSKGSDTDTDTDEIIDKHVVQRRESETIIPFSSNMSDSINDNNNERDLYRDTGSPPTIQVEGDMKQEKKEGVASPSSSQKLLKMGIDMKQTKLLSSFFGVSEDHLLETLPTDDSLSESTSSERGDSSVSKAKAIAIPVSSSTNHGQPQELRRSISARATPIAASSNNTSASTTATTTNNNDNNNNRMIQRSISSRPSNSLPFMTAMVFKAPQDQSKFRLVTRYQRRCLQLKERTLSYALDEEDLKYPDKIKGIIPLRQGMVADACAGNDPLGPLGFKVLDQNGKAILRCKAESLDQRNKWVEYINESIFG